MDGKLGGIGGMCSNGIEAYSDACVVEANLSYNTGLEASSEQRLLANRTRHVPL